MSFAVKSRAKTVVAIVTVLAIMTVLAIVTILAIKTNIYLSGIKPSIKYKKQHPR